MTDRVKRTMTAALVAACCLAAAGCGSDYIVVNTATSYVNDDGETGIDENTVMFDRRTGESWLLWSGDNFETGGESGYYWVPLKRAEFTLPPELAKTRLPKPRS